MLCNRIKQFREYNKLTAEQVANVIGTDVNTYNDFEKGEAIPTIDVIEALAKSYKVTIDEFYGYTPRLTLHNNNIDVSDDIPESILKMSDLSWDEAQLILYYRQLENKEEMLKSFIENDNGNK